MKNFFKFTVSATVVIAILLVASIHGAYLRDMRICMKEGSRQMCEEKLK